MMIGPYRLNEIYTGDARELLPAVPSGSAALAFVDPPYWVGFDYGGGRNDSNMARVDPGWLVSELRRIARVTCITPGIDNLQLYPKYDWCLGWFKGASKSRSRAATFNTWEPIAFYGKRIDSELTTDAIWLHQSWRRADWADGAFVSCPKPLDLMIWLINHLTKPGEVVIDPMCGSATTGAACALLNRKFLGFEIDPATAELARERVRNTQPPLPLVHASQGVLL